jgi:TolB-like protein
MENPTSAEAVATGTTFLLRGALQRSGGRVRVNLRLTAASADSTIWTGRFEGKETDILTSEDQIATATIDDIRKTPGSEIGVATDKRLRACFIQDFALAGK